MLQKRGLGKGLDALIPPSVAPAQKSDSVYHLLPIDQIVPNRLQPRMFFDEEKIRELAESIISHGVIQPLTVSKISDNKYELIAGERRLRACRSAGIKDVPAIIKDVDDETSLELALIENIQREDLNPIEEARAYKELVDTFGITQEEMAKKVGKSRSAVANSIRLLNLPKTIQDDISSGRYSAGHARAVLGVEGIHEQLKIRERIIKESLTVRDVENMVQSYSNSGRSKLVVKKTLPPHLMDIVEKLKARLGTKVSVAPKGNGGKIIIDYYSSQDMDRIYRKISI